MSNNPQDPSALTIARIKEEVANLKEVYEAKAAITDARVGAMDQAVQLLAKFPTAIDTAVGNLKELHQEKFEGVGTRLNELNTRLTQADNYKQVALDAALKAAQNLVDVQQVNVKESIKKTEDAVNKQIESLKEIVEDLKNSSRLREGGSSALHNGWLMMTGAVVIGVSVVGLILQFVHHAP